MPILIQTGKLFLVKRKKCWLGVGFSAIRKLLRQYRLNFKKRVYKQGIALFVKRLAKSVEYGF